MKLLQQQISIYEDESTDTSAATRDLTTPYVHTQWYIITATTTFKYWDQKQKTQNGCFAVIHMLA